MDWQFVHKRFSWGVWTLPTWAVVVVIITGSRASSSSRPPPTQTIMANSRILETTSEYSEKDYGELYDSIGWKESYAVGNFEGIIIEANARFEEI